MTNLPAWLILEYSKIDAYEVGNIACVNEEWKGKEMITLKGVFYIWLKAFLLVKYELELAGMSD